MKKIAVIGAGSWGTALALVAHRTHQNVTLYTRREEHTYQIIHSRENPYLPGIQLPAEIQITHRLETLKFADQILLVTPVKQARETCRIIENLISPTIPIVICCKGIEQDQAHNENEHLLTQSIGKILKNPLAVLSGPNFAIEIAKNLPAAATIASDSADVAIEISESLKHLYFRPYVSDDPIGVQVAGAFKNVLAIACGIVRGKQLGENAIAALITRGLAEMQRLGIALGGKSETFLGLAAVGDVMLTCSSEQSRNTRLGIALGQGKDLESILKSQNSVTEGVYTAASLSILAKKIKIPMPISQAVYSVLYESKSTDAAIMDILSKQAEWETDHGLLAHQK